jgi:flagellar hook-length control protein FliK
VSKGAVAASFATSNDEAARMLSHSLGQLRDALESTGISVGKLQVAQMPSASRSEGGRSFSDRSSSDNGRSPEDNPAQARDQQRRELLRRMWRRVSNPDDLDLVA